MFGAIFKNDFIENPIAYMLSGVIITTVFESSLNLASSTVDDMVSGFMKEVLVSPAKRLAVAMGQLLSAATVSTLQGILILILGLFIGIKFTIWTTPVFILCTMISVGLVFSGVGLFLATKVIVTPIMSFAIIVAIGLVFLILSTNSFVKTDFSRVNRSSSDANAIWG